MANIENLRPIQLTHEEAKKLGQKGGKKSGESRRLKKSMKQVLLETLQETNEKTGQTHQVEVAAGLLKGAKLGNATNFKAIVEMLGELDKEEDKVKQVEIKIINDEDLSKAAITDEEN